MKKRIITIIIFICFMFCCLIGVNKLLLPSIPIQQFYNQKENTIDVLCIGNSATYVNINPAIMWENGIASFNLCESSQMPWNTYYYLEEALKTQTPKLVIYDVYTMVSEEEYQALDIATQNTAGIRGLSTRYSAVKASVQDGYILSAFLGFPVYHKNYTSIIENYRKYWCLDKNGAITKGYAPTWYWSGYTGEISVSDGYAEIPSKNMEYLEKIYELVKSKGAELLLIKCPYLGNEYFDQVYNSVELYAQQNDIKFLNYNKFYEEIAFNYSYDIADACHLNDIGSAKVTEFLSDYILANYNIPDRRGDEKYSSWDEYLQVYNQTKFLCSEIISEKVIFEERNRQIVEKENPFGVVNMYSVDLKADTYYKILVTISTDEDIYLTVDLYGNNYDSYKQDMYFFVEKGDSQVIWTILNTETLPEDEVYLRLLGKYTNDVIIESVVVSELETKEKAYSR